MAVRWLLLQASAMLLAAAPVARAQEPTPDTAKVPEFAVGTELVRIGVVVTDGQGRPVSDLGPGDFVILEDKEPQEVSLFEAYSGGQLVNVGGPEAAPAALGSSAPGGEVEGYRRRFIVFAIDDLHIDPGSLSQAKEAMRRFVQAEVAPEDQVAVVAMSGALGLYQEFTTEPWILKRAISRLTPRLPRTDWPGPPQISEYQAELIERGDPNALDMAVMEILREQPSGANPEDAARIARTRARTIRTEASHYVRTTLQTLDEVMRGLGELPGRKVIVLVSDGFLLGIGTDNSQTFDIRRITDAGTRAGVVIYALDTRGLVATPPVGNAVERGVPSLTAPGVREAMAREAEGAVRDGMSGLAGGTGGFLVDSTNDLGAGLDRILKDTETYYLLAYQPTNTRRDGRFRRIEVRVPGRRGLEVRTRRGYFAPREGKGGEETPPGPVDAGTQAANDLRAALASLTPRTSVPVRLSANFVSLGRDGPQLVIDSHVDLAAVRFRRVDARYVATLVLAGVVYDDAGRPFAELAPQRVDLRLTREEYDRARKEGLKYTKTVAASPGSYEVRFVVRDDEAGRLGSASRVIEVPDPERGALTLSGLFLLRSADPATTGHAPVDPGAGAALRDVQAFPRYERRGSLYYQIQVLNPQKDASGDTHLTIQARVLGRGRLLASTRESPVVLSSAGAVPQAYTGRIGLGPLPPGEYEIQVAVTDHLVARTALRQVGFEIEE